MSSTQDNSDMICAMIRNYKFGLGDLLVQESMKRDLLHKIKEGKSSVVNNIPVQEESDCSSASVSNAQNVAGATSRDYAFGVGDSLQQESIKQNLIRSVTNGRSFVVKTNPVQDNASESNVEDVNNRPTQSDSNQNSFSENEEENTVVENEDDSTVDKEDDLRFTDSFSDSFLVFGDIPECMCPGCYMNNVVKMLDRHAWCPYFYDGNESLDCSGFSFDLPKLPENECPFEGEDSDVTSTNENLDTSKAENVQSTSVRSENDVKKDSFHVDDARETQRNAEEQDRPTGVPTGSLCDFHQH